MNDEAGTTPSEEDIASAGQRDESGPEPSGSNTRWGVIAAVIVLAIILVIVVLLALRACSEPEEVRVPNVDRLLESEATVMIEEAGLVVGAVTVAPELIHGRRNEPDPREVVAAVEIAAHEALVVGRQEDVRAADGRGRPTEQHAANQDGQQGRCGQ